MPPDLDNLTLLSTLLEIQTYYFMPLPGYSREMLKRNILKCYTTAETVIYQAMQLHRGTAFLHYAPHFVFRTLLGAICVVMSVHLSSPTKDFQVDAVDSVIKEAIRAMRTCSVQEGDLHIRVTNMLEKYWSMRAHMPRTDAATDAGVSDFSHRLGASLTFGCLRRWKRDVEQARDASTPNPTQQGVEALCESVPFGSLVMHDGLTRANNQPRGHGRGRMSILDSQIPFSGSTGMRLWMTSIGVLPPIISVCRRRRLRWQVGLALVLRIRIHPRQKAIE